MSFNLNLFILLFFLFLFLFLGLNIGLTLTAVAIIGFEFLANRGNWVGVTLYNSINSFVLSAVPFFIFMGYIILNTGLSSRLYKGVSKWTCVLPGGLLHSNIAASAIFAAISGSSPATAATIGSVAYPELIKRGYDKSIISGTLAAGGTLGILIPPSVNMIIYGAFVGVSVGRLFMAGIIPGIIISIAMMMIISFTCLKNKDLAPKPEKIKISYFWEALLAAKDVWPFILLMLAILGSIYGGFMTPTEAAAVSCFLSMLLGALFKKLNFTIIKSAAMDSLALSGMIILIYVGALLMGKTLAALSIPAILARAVSDTAVSPLTIWVAIVILYLILGMFMDTLAMMLITLPVTYPLVVNICGYDPVWFGIQLVLLCEIGMITPPVGINIFVIQGIDPELSQWEVVKGVFPYIIILIAFVFIFTFYPDIVLFLPNHVFG